MNFETKLSVHATETLHKQNAVLFDSNMAFASGIFFLYSMQQMSLIFCQYIKLREGLKIFYTFEQNHFTMKHIYLFIIAAIMVLVVPMKTMGQDLPKHMTEEEKLMWPSWSQNAFFDNSKVVAPPPGPVRAPGEWEELQALCITWTTYQSHLREIVRHAQMECKVIINCSDSNTVKSYLTSGGVPLTSNLVFNVVAFNSVWHRDYGSYGVYQNDVADLFLIDWKYNRPRPYDDVIPLSHATKLGLPIYECSANPYTIIHTGGNLMFDGFGTAMSSQLVVDENSPLTAAQVDARMNQFFGTSRYIKFTVLPYDGIHHIDMHMKLLDEERILLGEYPTGISDGPQIEANLAYLQANYNSVYGTPYKIIRIPMPHSPSNPNNWPSGTAYYRTYTNGVFVNKTFIYPTFYTKFDTTAARIYSEALPGYKIVGINCDPDPISASGAIHCITSNIWVENPLLISHQALQDCDSLGPYRVNALIKHRTGITSAHIYHTSDTTNWSAFSNMTLTDPANNTWTGYIPAYPAGSTVFYYIEGSATSGKTQVRPITAPDGWWKFNISVIAGSVQELPSAQIHMQSPFPNPARAITCVPIESNVSFSCHVGLYDINGRLIETLHDGMIHPGKTNVFFNAMDMSAGVYYVRMSGEFGQQTQKVVVYGY